MKLLRLAALALTCSALSFGASKEIIELQRDVALLQDKVDAMQRNLATKIDQLTGMVQAMQDNNTRTVTQLATLQDSLANGVSKSLAPVSGLSTKVDSMGDDVRSLKDALNDLSARLERMDAKITDVKNQVNQCKSCRIRPRLPGVRLLLARLSAPAAPGQQPSGQQPAQQPGQGSAAVPPPGMSADQSYTDAVRDMQTNKIDLAYQEFQQYLTYFPNTERAANAQYYIGEIDYNRGDYNGAVQAFDAVLERYPDNPKTPDAHLMKGMALLKANQRNRAVQEFRMLVSNYPHTNDAQKAQQELRQLGVSVSTVPARRSSNAIRIRLEIGAIALPLSVVFARARASLARRCFGWPAARNRHRRIACAGAANRPLSRHGRGHPAFPDRGSGTRRRRLSLRRKPRAEFLAQARREPRHRAARSLNHSCLSGLDLGRARRRHRRWTCSSSTDLASVERRGAARFESSVSKRSISFWMDSKRPVRISPKI